MLDNCGSISDSRRTYCDGLTVIQHGHIEGPLALSSADIALFALPGFLEALSMMLYPSSTPS